ncbi:alpha/beta fold hydrolase [Arsenicicoccus piscis]|uniref:esterase/lipase family protein n=1 Tax=Arsenicicoccus piscis TaxID=673954 RepID=UPI001F4D1D02|nr:alpha/beta fold hydrolase [Arsenicicoccus piscis]MCH8627547.1 alpha/beta fold hydrolase [Arsenicicoccus piscis]
MVADELVNAPAQHRPVVLIHGTNDRPSTLVPLAEALRATGRPVHLLHYGRDRVSVRGRLLGTGGLGDLAASTAEILAAVDDLCAATPLRVDLVGHSQGGLHALAVARARPERVAHVVLLGAPVLGVAPLGAASVVAHGRGVRTALDLILGAAARGQVVGSGQLPDLGAGGALAEGVRYLLVASRGDRMIRPADLARAPLPPGLQVTWVQTHEPRARVTHAGLPASPVVQRLVLAELATEPEDR